MRHFRHSPVLAGIAILVAAVVGAESWLLAETRSTLRTATLTMARKQAEWRRLAAVAPPPTATQAAAIETDLGRAEARLGALQTEAGSRKATAGLLATAGQRPVSRTDAFFDLAEFVRRMRELAGGAGVIIRAGEQFGFSAYGHAGPEPDLITTVLRQRQIAGYLLESLFASRLRQLVAVQRARLPRVKPEAGGATLNEDSDPRAGADVFEIDPRFSIREPGLVETVAFRLTFVGHTATLRDFLNRLTTGGIPMVVRSVEVEPVREAPPLRQGAPGSTDPLELIVRPAWSRFTVTVEFCEIVLPLIQADSRLAPPAPPLWPEPPAQRRGRGWIYEVFTPPALYYDPQAAKLSAMAVSDAAPPDPADAEIDLQLVEVRRGPFRLQLVGYAGGPENLRGIFVQPGTGETVIGHGGEHLAAQGLRVKRIDLCRSGAGFEDGAAITDVVATATVQDESTGEQTVLTNREPCLAGAPLGLFTSRKSPGFRCELREGEVVALNGVNYCLTHIDLQPPQVVIACMPPGTTEPRVCTLTPRRAPPPTERVSGAPAADQELKTAQSTP